MNSFHSQIKTALANPVLQAALDANAEKRILARKSAYASLPEPLEDLRQRAHTVRADTIRNLDEYLAQFIANLQANGIILHRAADSHEALQIILDIAREKNAKLIAKSKTMVSEEIGLNAALEAAGIQAIETDLGEYIVQLRAERPAHIITPAVHLRRQEVGQTFHEKLGVPETDHIPTLTDTARAALRQTFLDADIGISGVNFGVAESGSLCIVTNEGNGRMVTTLPPVHIALMGMERLVPSFDDLALMLSLLPRSATGQKITVYTQLFHGPRRNGESDGSPERHLILLDNGRSSLRGSLLNDALLCIRCGACLNACPVFRELGGHAYVGQRGQHTTYPGPIGSVVSPGLFGVAEFGHLAQASTLCGACKDACPIDIDLPEMLLRIRSGLDEVKSGVGLPVLVKWGLRLYTWASTSPQRFGLAQGLAAAFGRVLSPRADWMRLPAVSGWGYSKDFPRPALKPFRQRFQNHHRDTEIAETTNTEGLEYSVSPGHSKHTAPNPQSPISKFETELTALGGIFTRCTPVSLADEILTLLKERNINEIMAWEKDHLPERLLESLRERGIHLEHTPHPKLQVGLTGALAAVAETGTLVQTSGPGFPQSISLLPDIHIAVLRENVIYENLPQVLHLPEIREAATVSLISGPSRTADIEMTLTIGMHGPGEVHVYCIP
jgi:L-lactate dehydrogenase complex protein LldF